LDKRLLQLEDWLKSELSLELKSFEPASTDASFRRYFRVTTVNQSFVAMDAPPDKENLAPFITVARALDQLGIHAPKVHAQNKPNGFLLLEDLGTRTYLEEVTNNAPELYNQAIVALVTIQSGSELKPKLKLPHYNQKRLREEMDLFEKWFINKHLRITLNSKYCDVLKQTKQILVDECAAQPQVWVHRDYHSRNLMITDQNSPGVIDFQDMVIGPISYDLASIFKDCYVEWPRKQQLSWLRDYHELALEKLAVEPFSFAQLVRWYDMAGLQRHLKVLGIFCRLHYRDGKASYMNDLPLVAKYTLEVLNLYPEFAAFKKYFTHPIESLV